MNCEDKGYKEGEVFKIVSGDGINNRDIGSIVILKEDDGSRSPAFWLTEGRKDLCGQSWLFINIKKVKRIWPPEKETVSVICEGKTVEISRESAKDLNLI